MLNLFNEEELIRTVHNRKMRPANGKSVLERCLKIGTTRRVTPYGALNEHNNMEMIEHNHHAKQVNVTF